MSYFKTTLDNDITYLLQEIGHNCYVNNIPTKAIVNNLDRVEGYDDKSIITHEPIKRGDYIQYADKYFLVMDNVNASRYNTYYKAMMRVCNFDIKFIIGNKLYLFYSAIDGNKFTLNEGKLINMSADTISVTLPNTKRTNQLNVGISFIKWGRKWQIEGIDFTKNGLITLHCKIVAKNEATDDLENEIADRYDADKNDRLGGNTEPIKPFDTLFSVAINNPIDKLKVDETYQLIITTLDDDVVVENPAIYYHSSNTDVAIIDSNGLITAIAEGVTTITITFEDKQATMALMIEEAEQLPVYELTGLDRLRHGQTGVYTISKKINGVDVGGTFNWALSDTTLANFTEQLDTTCKVKANTNNQTGFINLTATDSENSEEITKEIEIIPFM